MSPIRTVLVLAGGAPVDAASVAPLPRYDMVIAADSGIEQAAPLGLHVDLIVGDLDSADQAAVTDAIETGTQVEFHPADKGATDLDLALAAAVRAGAEQIVVVGGGGGRLDHLFANAFLLASAGLARVEIEWRVGRYRVYIVRRQVSWTGTAGDLVSLLPVGGTAHEVSTDGLRWPLAGDDLAPGSTRGVSNEMLGAAASVSLESGTLLAMHRRQP